MEIDHRVPLAADWIAGFVDFGTFQNRGPIPALKTILGWVKARHFLRLLKHVEMCVRPILCRASVAFLAFFAESDGFGEFPEFY